MPRPKHKCALCGPGSTYKRSQLRGWRKKLYCETHHREVYLVTCFGCPIEHEGWPRTQLRKRKGVDYCSEHLPAKAETWPPCPTCGANDGWIFTWKKSVEKTTVHCGCGFKDKAINHFDALEIMVIASPIVT